MKINMKLIEELAQSVKLKFTKEEKELLVKEMNRTLKMINTLDEVDTEGIKGTYHGRRGEAVFRKDEPLESPEEVKAMLKQVRASKDDLIEVPAMLDSGEAGA